MGNRMNVFWSKVSGFVLSVAVFVLVQSTALAGPYSSNFDPLIAELQIRSATLTNVLDKIEVKQKKAVDKILATHAKPVAKPSLKMDMKFAKKAYKTLAKAFPTEFSTNTTLAAAAPAIAVTDLSDLIEDVLAAFGNDVNAILVTAQTVLNSAPDTQCKVKAQAVLDEVVVLLAEADLATDLPTLIQTLTQAAIKVMQGQAFAEAALECTSGGGGGGCGDWSEWRMSMKVDGVAVSAYHDANATVPGPDDIYVTYFSNGGMSVAMTKESGSHSLYFTTFIGNPVSTATTSIYSGGSFYTATDFYTITGGTFKITQWPSSYPGCGKATFSFTATGTAGTVNVTEGSFTVWIYPPF
jgi:hypothetical protein